MKKQKSLQSGQTLLEILLAFSVSVLVLSAIVIGVTGSLNNANYTKNQNLANSYAQEGMAVVRQIRDSSWENFFNMTDAKNYCLPSSNILAANFSPDCITTGDGKVGIFERSVVIYHDSDDCPNKKMPGTQVTVKVAWSDSKCSTENLYCHNVKLISCFSNIDEREEP
ncbi:MAG: hypothetical protein HY425_02920 [Candidatus Levybacteria bacterium]|nr:hypothetical protein [Candidatus Levybacteria bacterium]